MHSKKFSFFKSLIAVILALSIISPVGASTVQPRASDYLATYGAYIYPAGWGKVQVWFDVTGTGTMDEIGFTSIRLYESTDNENWTLVKTFKQADYPDMMGYDNFYYGSHVEYAGTIGRYYKAYLCVWAGKNGSGDTRYFWTSPVKATLFAGPTN